jgi:dihydroorotase
MKLELPKWYDLHAHFRQGDVMPHLVRDHLAMGCAGILAMPNTAPPVAKVFENDDLPYWSIEAYTDMLKKAGGDKFSDIIVPLYLTKATKVAAIEAGAKTGILRACKYYLFMTNGVFRAMEEAGVVLCIHGEEHGMAAENYFDRATNAEEYFYRERLPRIVEKFPGLKIVSEHLTTKVAVDFVRSAPATVAATVTPQHLLYTVGHLLQGLKHHLYCLPLLKFEEDRAALRAAVIAPANTKFFAGTDSAPHAKKVTECGCAAGCYTGGIAPQLYAQAFEEAGADLSPPSSRTPKAEGSQDSRGDSSSQAPRNDSHGFRAFENFLCRVGPEFYGLKIPSETFTLEKTPQDVAALSVGGEHIIPLPLGMKQKTLPWRIVQ